MTTSPLLIPSTLKISHKQWQREQVMTRAANPWCANPQRDIPDEEVLQRLGEIRAKHTLSGAVSDFIDQALTQRSLGGRCFSFDGSIEGKTSRREEARRII